MVEGKGGGFSVPPPWTEEFFFVCVFMRFTRRLSWAKVDREVE